MLIIACMPARTHARGAPEQPAAHTALSRSTAVPLLLHPQQSNQAAGCAAEEARALQPACAGGSGRYDPHPQAERDGRQSPGMGRPPHSQYSASGQPRLAGWARQTLPEIDDDDAWQGLLAQRPLPEKSQRFSSILALAAESTSQLARRPINDGNAHVELVEATAQLMDLIGKKKAGAGGETWPPSFKDTLLHSPRSKRRHHTHTTIGALHAASSPSKFSTALSDLEVALQQTHRKRPDNSDTPSFRPVTTAASTRSLRCAQKVVDRGVSPPRPATARAGDGHGYQAWRNLVPSKVEDETDRLFRTISSGVVFTPGADTDRVCLEALARREQEAIEKRKFIHNVHEQVAR